MFKRLLVVGAVLLVAGGASAQVNDFETEFSGASNPNGVWTYRSVDIPSANSAGVNMVFPDNCCGNTLWQDADGPPGPAAGRDTFSVIGSGLMHPGTSTDALLGYIYPGSATNPVTVDVSLSDGNATAGGDGKIVSFWVNDSQVGSSIVLPDQHPAAVPFNTTVPMSPGDVFVIRANQGGSNSFDSIGVSATFTVVPEPGSLALFLLGLPLFGRRFR